MIRSTLESITGLIPLPPASEQTSQSANAEACPSFASILSAESAEGAENIEPAQDAPVSLTVHADENTNSAAQGFPPSTNISYIQHDETESASTDDDLSAGNGSVAPGFFLAP